MSVPGPPGAMLIADERLLLLSYDLTNVRDGVGGRTVRSASAVLERAPRN